MVIFDLICENGHRFEGWFKDSDEIESQGKRGLLECPNCQSPNITKTISAPNVSKKSNSSAKRVSQPSGKEMMVAAKGQTQAFGELQKMLAQVHDYVDSNFKDVGSKFADEAMSIHRGEKDPELIRGTATKEEIKEMADQGVSAMPLPPKPTDKNKLN